MTLSSFLGIFVYNNIIATQLQRIIRNFAHKKEKRAELKIGDRRESQSPKILRKKWLKAQKLIASGTPYVKISYRQTPRKGKSIRKQI